MTDPVSVDGVTGGDGAVFQFGTYGGMWKGNGAVGATGPEFPVQIPVPVGPPAPGFPVGGVSNQDQHGSGAASPDDVGVVRAAKRGVGATGWSLANGLKVKLTFGPPIPASLSRQYRD